MVRLLPMTEAEFEVYLERAVKTYAEEKVRAGNWSREEALQRSEKDFLSLLPKGVASEGQHLFSIRDAHTDEAVGIVWFAVREAFGEATAFIYDFSVDEASRGEVTAKRRSSPSKIKSALWESLRFRSTCSAITGLLGHFTKSSATGSRT